MFVYNYFFELTDIVTQNAGGHKIVWSKGDTVSVRSVSRGCVYEDAIITRVYSTGVNVKTPDGYGKFVPKQDIPQILKKVEKKK